MAPLYPILFIEMREILATTHRYIFFIENEKDSYRHRHPTSSCSFLSQEE